MGAGDATSEQARRALDLRERVDDRLSRVEVVELQLVVEPTATAPRTQGEARDHGDTIVVLPVAEERRRPAGRPGAPHGGNQLEARFVREDEVRVPAREVLFTRAHARRFHSVIAASSRFSARRSGFCGVRPHWWRRRPTCAG